MADGLKTAVAEAMDEFDGEAEPVQAFLPLVAPGELAHLPSDPAARGRAIVAAPRGAGRPKGAKNKSTEAWRAFIIGRHGSPLEVLAQTWSRPVEVLADQLKCDLADAFEIQQRAAIAALPFLHGKMPVEVAIKGELPTLILADPAAFAAAMGSEENQPLNLLEMTPVGQSELDNGAEGEADQGFPAGAPLIADQQAEAAADVAPGAEGDR